MAGSESVVRRCTNCGQEYDLDEVGLTECKACYQPLGYWCKRDSEASGSWLTGPECRQCQKREERNRRRRDQRRKKREGSAETESLFDAEAEPAAEGEKKRGRRSAKEATREKEPAAATAAPAASAAPPADAKGAAPGATPTPTRPMLGSAPVPVDGPRIASVNSAGVVRRCMNCGTEYAPSTEVAECAVCFSGLGWWCRTHSPAGGAWLSGASCPLCALGGPAPPRPAPRPPIVAPSPRRPAAAAAAPRAAAPGSVVEEGPYLSPSLKALAVLYAFCFVMALNSAESIEFDLKLLGAGIMAGAAAIALRFRVTVALVVIAVFAAAAGFTWLNSLDPLAAGVFTLGSIGATRLRRTRFLAVTTCYLGVLYGVAALPLLDFLGIDRPKILSGYFRPYTPPPPLPRPESTPAEAAEARPASARANPDMDLLPTRIGAPRILLGHNAPAYMVTYMPGGKALLSLGQDSMLRTWHLGTGSELESHAMPPVTAALLYDYSPDGDLLAEVRAQNPFSLYVWNSRNNSLVRTFTLGSPVSSLAFSPPGVTVAAGTGGGAVDVFDVTTGRQIHHFVSPVGGPISAVAFADGRNLLAASGPRGVVVWDLAAVGDSSAPMQVLRGSDASRVMAAGFAPGGRTLITVSTEPTVSADLAIRYWDMASGGLLRTIKSEKTVPASACAIRPDGRQIACGSRPDLPGDSKIYLYDLTGP